MKTSTQMWTPEKDELLAKLLRDGLSASQIAAQFNVSRNAVIGRVHRKRELAAIGFERGLPHHRPKPKNGRVPTRKIAKPKPAPRVPLKPVSAPPKPVPVPITSIERVRFDEARARERITLVELAHDRCKFAVNDAAPGETFYFCGEPQDGESSYCLHHHKRVISLGTPSEQNAVRVLRAA